MKTVVEVRVPFLPLFADDVPRFLVVVAHRRAGKTVATLQRLVAAALEPGGLPDRRYAFVAPYRAQSKSIAWDYLKRFVSGLGASINEAELRADLPGGARIQLFGADNPDAIRGQYFDGAVLDEYAQMDPDTWDQVMRPALSDRGGWCTFIGTFKGRNAFWRLYRKAACTSGWGRLMLKASETGLIPDRELADLRASMSREAYEQELECSATANLKGAYYAELMSEAEKRGRITEVPYDPALPTITAWDLGVRDSTAIWIVQPSPGGAIHVIDYLESSGVGLDWYIDQLKAKRYRYDRHIAPADIAVVELGTGRSRKEVAAGLGVDFEVCRSHKVPDGIEAMRVLIPRMWFDAKKTTRLVDAMSLYRQEWDPKLQAFRASPLHDWTSHCADAGRYLAMSDALDSGFRGAGYQVNPDARINLPGQPVAPKRARAPGAYVR